MGGVEEADVCDTSVTHSNFLFITYRYIMHTQCGYVVHVYMLGYWVGVQGELAYHPSSQGWAPRVLPLISLPVCCVLCVFVCACVYVFLCGVYIYTKNMCIAH